MSLYLGENLISGQTTLVGESRNIGQIISSTIPLTDAGLHLLDGALINGSGIYSAFVDYIAGLVSTYPNLFVTESAWQSAVTTYGVCDKFVYDATNNTVRLPKYGTQIITKTPSVASTVPVRGNGITLGLTNGSGLYGLSEVAANVQSICAYGSNYGTSVGHSSGGTGTFPGISGRAFGVTTDATKSGIIAVTSSLLTDYPLDCYYYIVLATSTKTDIEVDIDEVVTDLNGKADRDLLNLSDTGNIQMAKASMPSNRYIDLTFTHSASYQAPADGWFTIGGYSNNTSVGVMGFEFVDTGLRYMTLKTGTTQNGFVGISTPVAKGQTVRAYNYGATTTRFRFIYAVGSESEAS